MPTRRHRVSPDIEAAIRRRLAYLGSNIQLFPPDLLGSLDALIAEAGLEPVPDEAFDLAEFLYLDPSLQRLLQTPIADLGFSARVSNALHWRDIVTLEDLVEWSETEIGKMRNLGRTSMAEIKVKLMDDLGLHLSRHDERELAPPPGDAWVMVGRAGLDPGSNPVPRQVLRSRVPRLLTSMIMLDYNPDDAILWIVEHGLGVRRVWQLAACKPSQLRELDWRHLTWSPRNMDPAEYAIARIEAMLKPYGLTLTPE